MTIVNGRDDDPGAAGRRRSELNIDDFAVRDSVWQFLLGGKNKEK